MSTKKVLLAIACALSMATAAPSQTASSTRAPGAGPMEPEARQVAAFLGLGDKIAGAQPIRVAFLGASITGGATTSPSVGVDEFGPYDFSWYLSSEDSYRAQIVAGMQERFGVFPGQFVQTVASLGGTGSVMGAYRVAQNVIADDPDLVFVEFVVNDANSTSLDAVEEGSIPRALQSIVTQLREHDAAVAIFGVHSTVRDNGQAPPTELQKRTARSGRQHRRFFSTLDEPIPFFDVHAAYYDEPLPHGVLGPLFRGRGPANELHPAPDGHSVTAQGCLAQLEDLLFGPGFVFPRLRPYAATLEPFPRHPRVFSAAELLASTNSTGFEVRDAESSELIFEETEALYATGPSAALRFDFSGEAVGLWCQYRYAKGVIQARIEVFLDGESLGIYAFPGETGEQRLNKFTPLRRGLEPRPHTLLVRVLDTQPRDFRFALHGILVDEL